jgi:hypothetical protein
MEWKSVEKMKVMRIKSKTIPVHIMIDQIQLESVEYFKCLGSVITNDASCTRGIKSRIAMAKCHRARM